VSIKADCVSDSWQAFFRCGINIGFDVMKKSPKKKQARYKYKGEKVFIWLAHIAKSVVGNLIKPKDICFFPISKAKSFANSAFILYN
jgi:hypothetical protein